MRVVLLALLLVLLCAGCKSSTLPTTEEHAEAERRIARQTMYRASELVLHTEDGRCWNLVVGGRGYDDVGLSFVGAEAVPCE